MILRYFCANVRIVRNYKLKMFRTTQLSYDVQPLDIRKGDKIMTSIEVRLEPLEPS